MLLSNVGGKLLPKAAFLRTVGFYYKLPIGFIAYSEAFYFLTFSRGVVILEDDFLLLPDLGEV